MADYEPQASFRYTSALERLVGVVGELSFARDIGSVAAIVRDAARALTGADGAAFVLREGEQCCYVDESSIAPLWKGRRFPMEDCVSGWVMRNARPAVIEDVYADPRVAAEAYRPTFVKSLVMVPIRRDAPVGAIGNYWSSRHESSGEEVAILQALADTTSVALENAELYKRLQQQVATLERQQVRIQSQHARLEVFTLAFAHDLKEPVRTLVSYSGMLRAEPEEREKLATYVGYIRNAASRVDMLIDAVSRYTRLDDLSPPVRSRRALAGIVEEARRKLAGLFAERGAQLRCEEDLPELDADPAHLLLLFQNLIGNAVLHNGHPVTVTIRRAVCDGHSEFSVSDDGAGMNTAQTEQIFLPFRRLTHRQGCAGLGLAICRRIVALYGGEIRCESAAGSGATFIFTLPGAELAEFDPGCTQKD